MATEDMLTKLPLATFELPQWLVQPAVRSCRLFNTARFHVLRRTDAPPRAGREGRTDAGPGRKAPLADH